MPVPLCFGVHSVSLAPVCSPFMLRTAGDLRIIEISQCQASLAIKILGTSLACRQFLSSLVHCFPKEQLCQFRRTAGAMKFPAQPECIRTIASKMVAEDFLKFETLLIMGLGLVAFIVDTFGGIMIAKIINIFSKNKINPMIGAAGISAFPMSARVVHKMGLAEDNQNFLLMHSVGVNVSGQVASVIAGGLILTLVGALVK